MHETVDAVSTDMHRAITTTFNVGPPGKDL